MSDFRRILDDERAPPHARALLQSAAEDGLDEGRLAALAGTFGAQGCEISSGGAPVAARLRSAVLTGAKWGVVAILAAGAALPGHGDSAAPSAPATRSIVTTSPGLQMPVSDHRETAPPPEASSPETIPVALLPVAPPEPSAPPVQAGSRKPSREANSRASGPVEAASGDLPGEVRALERVRLAIAEHRIGDARAGLTTYAQAYPKSLLGKEARVLEIETLLADGRREEAEALASSFLATSPDSPYATRVRSLISAPRLP